VSAKAFCDSSSKVPLSAYQLEIAGSRETRSYGVISNNEPDDVFLVPECCPNRSCPPHQGIIWNTVPPYCGLLDEDVVP
jgi:hypothetical protein